MRKNANPRTYLSQLAEPLLPGDPVLRVRPGGEPYSGSERSLIPVVEDRFVVREAAQMREEVPAVSPGDLVLKAADIETSTAPAPVAPEPAVDGKNGRTDGDVADTWAASAAPQLSDEREWAPRTELMTRMASNTAASEFASPSLPSMGKKETRADIPKDNEHYAERNASWDLPASNIAAQEFFPKIAAGEESRTSAGVRVHIGTLEIRAVLPTPPSRPAPVLPSVKPENRAARSRIAGEPLTRGLVWSYGLVQG
jgi:hypothetical protein